MFYATFSIFFPVAGKITWCLCAIVDIVDITFLIIIIITTTIIIIC